MGGCGHCSRRWTLRPQARRWTGPDSAPPWAPGSQRAGRTGPRSRTWRLVMLDQCQWRTTDMCPQQPPSSRVTTWMSPPPVPRPRGCGAVPGNWQPRMPNCSGMLSWPRSSTPAWPRRLHSSRHSCEGASKGSRALGLDQHPGNAETPFGPGSSRQALEQARVAVEELDDMKAMVKQLEEENAELRRQARHAEKQQYSLGSRAEALQEENQQLLAEGQGLREQIQAQAARMASLEAQLCHGTALLSARDTALAQAGQRTQELTAALEEYERVVQELRLETTRLRQQLGRMRDAWAMYGGDVWAGNILRRLWSPHLGILTLLSPPQAPVVPAQPAGHPGHSGSEPGDRRQGGGGHGDGAVQRRRPGGEQ
uniref:KASH5-like coiled-coil domain-containing protein n=1 Tax=Cyanistes caeruleus TaxID=156563 RepID=A0A8C0U2B0_CYACU